MYTLMRDGLSIRSARLQLPSLAITILVAETFYKFHSFTLEFLVALATWTAVDLLLSGIARGLDSLRGRLRPGSIEPADLDVVSRPHGG